MVVWGEVSSSVDVPSRPIPALNRLFLWSPAATALCNLTNSTWRHKLFTQYSQHRLARSERPMLPRYVRIYRRVQVEYIVPALRTETIGLGRVSISKVGLMVRA